MISKSSGTDLPAAKSSRDPAANSSFSNIGKVRAPEFSKHRCAKSKLPCSYIQPQHKTFIVAQIIPFKFSLTPARRSLPLISSISGPIQRQPFHYFSKLCNRILNSSFIVDVNACNCVRGPLFLGQSEYVGTRKSARIFRQVVTHEDDTIYLFGNRELIM